MPLCYTFDKSSTIGNIFSLNSWLYMVHSSLGLAAKPHVSQNLSTNKNFKRRQTSSNSKSNKKITQAHKHTKWQTTIVTPLEPTILRPELPWATPPKKQRAMTSARSVATRYAVNKLSTYHTCERL
jgi:hypothetical protein